MLINFQNNFYVFFKIVIIELFFYVLLLSADCPYNLQYLNVFNITQVVDKYQLIQNTYNCFENLKNVFPVIETEELDVCNEGDLDVSFYPHSVLPNGTSILPYITLNISVTAYIPIDRLFIQFRCLHAPDQSDKYCHDHADQRNRWGRMIWPCRELQLDGKESEISNSMVVRFSYNCFNLFGLSQYEVNVTVTPKRCRSTYFVTIPTHRQLEPKVRHFYQGGGEISAAEPPNDWSPLLYADMSLPDGIWLRFRSMLWILPSKFITITVLERLEDDKTRFLFSEKISLTENGFKWENVPAGEYLIFVFVNRFDCKISCHSGDGEDCKICAHTVLNFTVPIDKFSVPWRQTTTVVGVAKALIIAIFLTLTFIIIALLVVLLYLRVWRPRQLAGRPVENVELKENPRVLILYTDDCELHSNTVLALANLLVQSANAHVLIDQLAFQDPSVRPSIWLLNAISEAQFILLIFSECSKRVLTGEKLVQRRPFPDLFNTAISYVFAKINEITAHQKISSPIEQPKNGFSLRNALKIHRKNEFFSLDNNKLRTQLNQFIVTRFPYSQPSVIPDFFSRDLFRQLCLPQDMGFLFGCLHGIAPDFPSLPLSETERSRFECSANLDELKTAISEFECFNKNNPNWMTERFPNVESDNNLESEKDLLDENGFLINGKKRLNERLERLTPKPFETILSVEEQEEIITKYNLEAPLDDFDTLLSAENEVVKKENETTSEQFGLVGKMEDFCNSSSSSSMEFIGPQ